MVHYLFNSRGKSLFNSNELNMAWHYYVWEKHLTMSYLVSRMDKSGERLAKKLVKPSQNVFCASASPDESAYKVTGSININI